MARDLKTVAEIGCGLEYGGRDADKHLVRSNDRQCELFGARERGMDFHIVDEVSTERLDRNLDRSTGIQGAFATTVRKATVREIDAGFDCLDSPEK